MQPNELSSRGNRWIVWSLVIGGSVAPLVCYWLFLGRVSTVTPWRAKEMLGLAAENVLLIDVRERGDYAVGHIDGSVNWPRSEIVGVPDWAQLPHAYRGRTLLLICDVGLASVHAATYLDRVGVADARNVRGGIQEWIRSADRLQGEQYDRWRTGPGRVEDFPYRQPTWKDQIVAVTAFFVVKPVYSLLSLLVIVVLWKSDTPDLVALRWGMICFFLGENACAVNVLAFKETSYLLEYLHSTGMVLCFGFVAFAVLDGFDRRILGVSDPDHRCAAIALCGQCIKQADVPCGLRRVFHMLIPLCAVLALMLPVADWHDRAYNTTVFGEFYHYGHLRVFQLFEQWVCPLIAVVLFGASWVALVAGGDNGVGRAKVLFAGGCGPLGFGFLRWVFAGIYDESRVWFAFWEETTELLFVAAICFVLWTFKAQLIPNWAAKWDRVRKSLHEIAEGQ